jgi:hypothetical protein
MDKTQYHLKGFHIGKFAQNEDLKRLLSSIQDIHSGNIKTGFSLVNKYKNSEDLKPEVATYDDSFVNILFSSDIPKLLKEITGLDLYLAHIQLRISYRGRSYMIWHRDTHVYGGNIVGNIPPVHKIIFYPTVDGVPELKLKVSGGSHRKVFGNKVFDFLQLLFSKKTTIKSSDTDFLLFNTELFHHVVPERNPKGSFRLIYSFAQKEQLKNYAGEEKLIERYQEKLKN